MFRLTDDPIYGTDSNGIIENQSHWNQDLPTLPRALQAAGYRTADNDDRMHPGYDDWELESTRAAMSKLLPDDTTVAQILKQAGYRTGLFGKWSLGGLATSGYPTVKGYDEWFGYVLRPTHITTIRSCCSMVKKR